MMSTLPEAASRVGSVPGAEQPVLRRTKPRVILGVSLFEYLAIAEDYGHAIDVLSANPIITRIAAAALMEPMRVVEQRLTDHNPTVVDDPNVVHDDAGVAIKRDWYAGVKRKAAILCMGLLRVPLEHSNVLIAFTTVGAFLEKNKFKWTGLPEDTVEQMMAFVAGDPSEEDFEAWAKNHMDHV